MLCGSVACVPVSCNSDALSMLHGGLTCWRAALWRHDSAGVFCYWSDWFGSDMDLGTAVCHTMELKGSDLPPLLVTQWGRASVWPHGEDSCGGTQTEHVSVPLLVSVTLMSG